MAVTIIEERDCHHPAWGLFERETVETCTGTPGNRWNLPELISPRVVFLRAEASEVSLIPDGQTHYPIVKGWQEVA